jgi:hexokinase
MNPTWCMAFPTGYETGTYLALDMGGTNLRVCEIVLTDEKSEFDIIQSKYRMPEELKTGESEELWEYIADCLQQFIETHHQGEKIEQLPLGFTFSYPATQNYIDEGILQRWTKGFDIDGVEGKNVVPMFEEALAKRVSHSLNVDSAFAKKFLGRTNQGHCFDQRYYRYFDRLGIY